MIDHRVSEEIVDYLAALKASNTEEAKKLRFHNLLTRLFSDSAASRALVDQMAAGGEKTIFNIPRKGAPKTGYADIAYSNVIIEWEKDLAKTGRHAEDQLAEYLAGKWHSGERYDFVLIATDGRIWRSYAPDLEVLLAQVAPSRVALRKVEDFEVKRDNEQQFFYFLDRLLFRSTQRKATLGEIQLDFGDTSRAFINTVQAMRSVMPGPGVASPVHVAFEQWQRFLELAYGRFDDRKAVYLIHTYLSVFSKLLAYVVLRPAARPDDDRVVGLVVPEEDQPTQAALVRIGRGPWRSRALAFADTRLGRRADERAGLAEHLPLGVVDRRHDDVAVEEHVLDPHGDHAPLLPAPPT